MKVFIKSRPKVVVLLASYKGLPWIDEQITSILEQENVDIQLTISDDNSDDGTIDYLQKKQLSHPIRLLPATRSGSAALNFFRLLIDQDISGFDYVALSDQDDIWLPQKLNRAIEAIRHQNVDAYSSNVRAFWADGKSRLINKAQPQTSYDYMFESAGPGCSFVLSNKLAIELQQLLKNQRQSCKGIALHDWFIYAFARSNGYKWYIDPMPNLLYRQHAGNVVGANTGIKAIQTRLLKLNQGWYMEQVLLIAKTLGYQNSRLIQKVSRLNLLDRCYLAMSANHFRRRLRDQFAFALFILFLAKKR